MSTSRGGLPWGQLISCNCLTIIMACVVYWQAKELDRLINTDEFAEMGFDLELVKHISPVNWDNVILYGEYIINKLLINQKDVSALRSILEKVF